MSSSSRVALVTGAAGIIGPGICAALRDAGWSVAATDVALSAFSQRENAGVPVASSARFPADLADPAQIERLVADVRAQLGPIRLLVNNATGHNRPCPFGRINSAEAERVWGVDLRAPILLAQASASDLTEGGLIVNFSSVRVTNPSDGSLLYSVAKAGVEHMTSALASELSSRAIRVCCLRIGSVPGDAFLRPAMSLLPPDLAARLRAEILPAHLAAVGPGAALDGIAGRPEEIGRIVAHLASPEARYLNGTVVALDGGYALAQQRLQAAGSAASPLASAWLEQPAEKVAEWLRSQARS